MRVSGAQHLARPAGHRAAVGRNRRPGRGARQRDRRHALHGVDGGVRRAGASLHPRVGLPRRDPGAEPQCRNRERDRLLRQHPGDADAARVADDVPGIARADQGQRSRRSGSLARRPGMAGARIQSRPPARCRANDAGQLRITRARRWWLQSARRPVRARRAARPHQSTAARFDDRIGWPGPRCGGRSRIPGRSSRPSAGGATAAALRRAVGTRAREPGHDAVGMRTDERGGRRMAARRLGR